MNPLATKGLIGLGGLSAVGGGVFLSKPYLFPNKPTLKSIIEKDGWTLLTPSNSDAIAGLLNIYKQKQPAPFSGFTGNEVDASSKLLQECKTIYERTMDDSNKSNLISKLKRWCVIPQTAKERLSYLNVSLFSGTAPTNPNTENKEWIDKAKTYTTNAENKFSDLSFNSEGENDKAKKLREHCNTKLNVKSTEESFDDTLNKIKSWCSNN